MHKMLVIIMMFCFTGLSSNLSAMDKSASFNNESREIKRPQVNFEELVSTLGIDPSQSDQLQVMMRKHRQEHDEKRVEKRQKHKQLKTAHRVMMDENKRELGTILNTEQLETFHQYMQANRPKHRRKYNR